MVDWYQGMIREKSAEAQRLKERSNLGARFEGRTFGNFDPRFNRTAFYICRDYSNREDLFEGTRNSLILLGGYGTGKTHLAAAIANDMISKGIPVLFGTFSEHLERIRSEFDTKGAKTYLGKMKYTPLLVLDDVGKEKATEWTEQILFDVINYRYEHMLPFVLTSNLTEEQLGNYVGGAVYSRMCEMCIEADTGNDDRRIGR